LTTTLYQIALPLRHVAIATTVRLVAGICRCVAAGGSHIGRATSTDLSLLFSPSLGFLLVFARCGFLAARAIDRDVRVRVRTYARTLLYLRPFYTFHSTLVWTLFFILALYSRAIPTGDSALPTNTIVGKSMTAGHATTYGRARARTHVYNPAGKSRVSSIDG
jgi:hypothetical protein